LTSVLHVISGLDTGGAEMSLVQLTCALQQRGLPQHVVSLGGEGAYGAAIKSGGVALTTLNLTFKAQAPAALFRLMQLMHRYRPQVIQGWMYHGNLLAALAHRTAGGRSIRRLLWNLRASNMDAERYGRLIRWSATFSGWPDVVVSNSKAGLDFHMVSGYRPRQTIVIANGIDTGRFLPDASARAALRAELAIPEDAVVVIHAARVDPMKDHATLFQTMEKIPNAVGIMAGYRTDTLKAPANLRALGLRHDLQRLYAAADIVVSTSAFGEGFSNAVAEGMSTGLIPVSTDVGDARSIVGDTGHVVPARDPAAMADVISRVMALSAADRLAQGLRARARISEHFSMAAAVDQYERLYLSVAAGGASG
jgi:glycosyltransferase involved in cell wall biosynthesis